MQHYLKLITELLMFLLVSVILVGCAKDNFVPIIKDFQERGTGKVVECSKENIDYFYSKGSVISLPASVMRKSSNKPWEAIPVNPNPLPTSKVKDIGILDLVVSPENCNEVYVVTEQAEAYKTRNGGKLWEKIYEIPPENRQGRSLGWGITAINTKNIKHLVIGFNVPIHSEETRPRFFESFDGGKSFLPCELGSVNQSVKDFKSIEYEETSKLTHDDVFETWQCFR